MASDCPTEATLMVSDIPRVVKGVLFCVILPPEG